MWVVVAVAVRVLLTLLLLLLLLGQDVPAAINGLLDSLPSKVSVQGLPFDAIFTYAVYTLNYVIVKVSLESVQQQVAGQAQVEWSLLAAQQSPSDCQAVVI
jgi:hypothetical protein